ncbi:MAG TPA: hypothetical protein VGC79_07815, partial [Polyangiaceae bacterium]
RAERRCSADSHAAGPGLARAHPAASALEFRGVERPNRAQRRERSGAARRACPCRASSPSRSAQRAVTPGGGGGGRKKPARLGSSEIVDPWAK